MFWQLYSHGRKLCDGHAQSVHDVFPRFPRDRWEHAGTLGDEEKYESAADPLRVIYIRPNGDRVAEV